MSVDINNPDVWALEDRPSIRTAAARYRVWADQEDRNGFPRLAADMRRMADKLDRLYGGPAVTVEVTP